MADHFWNEIWAIVPKLDEGCKIITAPFDLGYQIGIAFYTPHGRHAVGFRQKDEWKMGRKHARKILRTMQHKTNYKAFMNGNQG